MTEALQSMDGDNPSELPQAGSARGGDAVEREAIRRCQNGDISGLETLYKSYSEKIFRTCYRILGDRTAAEDQTHEVFLRVFEQIGRFGGHSRFSTWLYRLAVNQTLNRLRSRKRRLLKTIGLDHVEGLAAHNPSPERETLLQEQKDHVQAMLARLSDEHRTVLVLREIEGLSYAEISEVLGIPPGTVMSRLHRGRHELKISWSSRNSEQATGVQRERGDEKVE